MEKGLICNKQRLKYDVLIIHFMGENMSQNKHPMDLQPVMSLAHLMCNTIKINRKLVQDNFSFNNTWNFIAFPNSQSLFSSKSHSNNGFILGKPVWFDTINTPA